MLKAGIFDKFLKSNGIVFTFLRSTVSSQISSWTDMILSFVFYAWVHLYPWLATALGAFFGGVVNCVIGYKFTFHAQGQNKRAVMFKFFLVWLGSLILNSGGTEALFHLLRRWHWLETLGFKPDGYFAAARLTVSLIVSLAWNFILQRWFVFSPTRFDSTAIRIVDSFIPQKIHKP
ncbi:MAG: GtrA family protein [Bacteroides sp.]|nr:GtrA family protein [Bacteroides sp.]